MAPETMIECENLTRRFGHFTAVDHVSLKIAKGSIFGFLGPNGSGKSTVIRMLCGLLEPSEGSARIGGFDVTKQTDEIKRHNIPIVEKEITSLNHKNGVVEEIVFSDNSTFQLKVIYSRPPFEQHCKIPEWLGCELTEQGLIKVDAFQKTTVDNIFACGDNTNPLRAVSYAVSTGNNTGVFLNNALVEEDFLKW